MRKKRVVSAITLLCIIFTMFNFSVQAADAYKPNMLIEAENTYLNNGMNVERDAAASGGKFLVLKNKRNYAKDIVNPDIAFNVCAENDDEYTLYARLSIPTSSADTTFFRFDRGEWQDKTFSTGGWRWLAVEKIPRGAGTHRIELNHQDSGIMYDAFFVTDNPDILPQYHEEKNTEILPSHIQEKIYTVTGKGIIIQAEDATYYSNYKPQSDRAAAGLVAMKATTETKTVPSAGSTGELEVKFTVEEDEVCTVWARIMATTASQDSVFAAMNDGSYANKSLTVSQDFKWYKIASAMCKKGEESVVRFVSREQGGFIDEILIATDTYTPIGRTGGIEALTDETAAIVSEYERPPVNPPMEHPRVLFRTSDIPKIKANMETEENRIAKEKFMSFVEKGTDGDAKSGYSKDIINTTEALAFDYVINGNKQSGYNAAAAIITCLQTTDPAKGSDEETRNAGYLIYVASEVYDWCYDILTNAQKEEIIKLCEMHAMSMEIGWPPVKQGAVVGHAREAQLLRCLLAFAIAVYDERPDIWNIVGGRFYQEFTKTIDYFNRAHFNLQGDSYGLYRHMWESWSYFLITGMGAPSPYNTEDLYNVSYSMIYMRRPDGQYLRDGDTTNDTASSIWSYWKTRYLSYQLDSNIGSDGYLKEEFYKENENGATFYDGSPILFLITNKPEVKVKPVSELPLSRYFGSPAGVMMARTGWEDGTDSPAVVAEMKIGEVQTNNHQHLDAGHFQIYYKGILASDSGVYQGLNKSSKALGGTAYGAIHANTYGTKSIAHNTMLVYDPAEGSSDSTARGNIIDGGQRAVNNGNEFTTLEKFVNGDTEVAKTEAWEIDPKNRLTPAYTYIKGDLTNAYSDKVKEFKRSFMFLNLFDDKIPAAMVVFDKVTSSSASYKKTWLLHGIETPDISGNTAVFKRTYASTTTGNKYNGRLVLKALLPEADDIMLESIGGEDGYSIIDGKDYTGTKSPLINDEGDTYRLEISPKSRKNTDYFLNVMFVGDADRNDEVPVTRLETDKLYGVKVADRVVCFSKSGLRNSEDFSIASQGSNIKYTICDMESGEYTVKSGENSQVCVVTEEGGVLSFTASGAEKISIHRSGNNSVQNIEDRAEAEAKQSLYVRINGSYVYSNPAAEIKAGNTYMPIDTFCRFINAQYSFDGSDAEIRSVNNRLRLAVQSDSCSLDGTAYPLSGAAYVKNDVLMIPVRSVAELLGCKVTYESTANIVSITKSVDYTLPDEYFRIKEITPDAGPVDGKNVCTNIADSDGGSIWAALGKERYVQFELEQEQTLTTVEIVLNPNSGRNAEFEVMVSDDGVKFKSVLSGKGDGSVETGAWEVFRLDTPQSAKYIRYYGRGSNISDWNAVQEIRFK